MHLVGTCSKNSALIHSARIAELEYLLDLCEEGGGRQQRNTQGELSGLSVARLAPRLRLREDRAKTRRPLWAEAGRQAALSALSLAC